MSEEKNTDAFKKLLELSLLQTVDKEIDGDERKAISVFINSAQKKKATIITHILKQDFNLEQACLFVISEGGKEEIQFLLDCGMDINSFKDNPPLPFFAARGDTTEVCQNLISFGAQIDATYGENNTALLFAAGHEDNVCYVPRYSRHIVSAYFR